MTAPSGGPEPVDVSAADLDPEADVPDDERPATADPAELNDDPSLGGLGGAERQSGGAG